MSFPRYESYKDSGIEWLGEVPEHWDVKKIKYLFEIKKRIAGSVGYDVLSITQHGIKVKDIESGDGQLSMDYSKYQFVKVGDFAMNHMDLLTGYVDLSTYLGVTSPDYRVFTIRDNQSNIDRYFLYLLQVGYRNKIFFAFGQGSSQLGRWRFPTEQFNKFEFPCPHPNEQKQIAQFLDQETAKIDNLIAEQQQLIKLLKEKLISMVLSEVNSTEYYEDRLENISEKVSRPVNLDEYEYYTPIGLFNRGRGLFHKEARAKDEMGDSDFFWIKENDLILSGQFAWEGSVALADIEDSECVVSHRYPVLRGRKNICLTEYLYAFFLTKHGDFFLNENSRGAAGRNKPLNINSLMKEKIPLPSMELQKKVRCLVHDINPLQKEIGSQINLLKERRSTLISLVVAGKIDVRNYVSTQSQVETMA